MYVLINISYVGGVDQGDMVFMDDATFTGNLNDNLEYGSGPGGALANHVKGTMHFMGNLNMVDNEADVSDIEPSRGHTLIYILNDHDCSLSLAFPLHTLTRPPRVAQACFRMYVFADQMLLLCFVVFMVCIWHGQDYFGGAEGGAIFNRGDIIVDGDALFDENYSGVSKQCDGCGRFRVPGRITRCF